MLALHRREAMPNYPHLNNAPVVEAVIELRTRLAKPVGPAEFNAFRDRLQPRYQKAQHIQMVKADFRLETDAPKGDEMSRQIVGVRLDDTAGQWAIQGKSDGLTVSRLAPYSSWDDLVTTVRALWRDYVELFTPEMVTRLGVRYINLLPVPVDKPIDLDSMLTAGPRIPKDLPQEMTEFMTRLVLPIPENGIVLTVVQAPGATPSGASTGSAGVILDIDAACDQNYALNQPAMWEKLEQLHDAKNMAFFGSVTRETWETFV